MEQNTFKSLLSRLSLDNILPEFKAIFRKLRPDLFEQEDWNIYRDIYQDLRTREADTSQYSILIFERWEDASDPGSNCCVGYEDGDNYDYRAIGGYPFLSEILGMEITISNGITLTPQELAAGLLWEITYAQRNGLADLDTEHLTFKYLLTRFSFDDILPDFKQISNIYIKRMHWTHFVMQIGKHTEKCTKIFKATKYRKHGMSSIWHPVGRDVLQ